jgi:hypothetical protein
MGTSKSRIRNPINRTRKVLESLMLASFNPASPLVFHVLTISTGKTGGILAIQG